MNDLVVVLRYTPCYLQLSDDEWSDGRSFEHVSVAAGTVGITHREICRNKTGIRMFTVIVSNGMRVRLWESEFKRVKL